MGNIEDWKDETALARHQIISTLVDASLDASKRQLLREQLASQHGLSTRTLRRYEKAYTEIGFKGLKPKSHDPKPSPKLPGNFKELLDEAILLKREVPSRSINQIILILELEGKVKSGVLSRSTLQRHLQKSGYSKKQMKQYTEAGKVPSAGRFVKPHRMMLLQADIKYGPKLPIGKNKKMVQTYLSALIDDHSRYLPASGFYDNQEATIVEDTVKKAILRFGKFDVLYTDNGGQYISKHLRTTCAKLGIRVLRTKPYVAKSKGKIEKLNKFVDAFLAEFKASKGTTLEELNASWDTWLNSYYHKKVHEGLLTEGVSPEMEWNRDSRRLTFLDTNLVAEAFLHYETRRVDKSGCISFKGCKYEVGLALIGATVEIAYDPMAYETITVTHGTIPPIMAKPIVIGEFCDKAPKLPEHMLPIEPKSSRFLDALKKVDADRREKFNSAISFSSYKKEAGGTEHV